MHRRQQLLLLTVSEAGGPMIVTNVCLVSDATDPGELTTDLGGR
jgi:hypothetical protein